MTWLPWILLAVLLLGIRPAPASPPAAPARARPLLLTPGAVIPAVTLTEKTRLRRPLESDDPATTTVIVSPALAGLGPWPLPAGPVIDTTARTQEVPIIHFDDLTAEGGDDT